MTAVPPIVMLSAFLLLNSQQPSDCTDAAGCRQAALDAAEAKDFEAFHDLAWRAAQKGRPNDPELMLLLARAQSLSGRPGDALVMLRRLAERGVAPDIAENEDFRRVRALAGWPELAALIEAARARAVSPPEGPEPAPPAIPEKAVTRKPERIAAPPPAPRAAAEAAAEAAVVSGGENAVSLTGAGTELVGLAYDSISRRFVVADRRSSKLIVADEVFKRVNDLIGAGAGGFGRLNAVEIDTRRGDLWVTSMEEGGAATVHKLQLVSGRLLFSVSVPDDLQPASLADIAVTDSGALTLLDSAGSRILTLGAGSRTLHPAIDLGVTSASSIASDGQRIFVAHNGGLSVADRKTGRVSAVRAGEGVSLEGVRRIRLYRGSLIAIQDREEPSAARLVRIRLARSGTTASKVEVLDGEVPSAPAAMTVAGNDVYYLTDTDAGPVIRHVSLAR
jgi:hypothetical protein